MNAANTTEATPRQLSADTSAQADGDPQQLKFLWPCDRPVVAGGVALSVVELNRRQRIPHDIAERLTAAALCDDFWVAFDRQVDIFGDELVKTALSIIFERGHNAGDDPAADAIIAAMIPVVREARTQRDAGLRPDLPATPAIDALLAPDDD